MADKFKYMYDITLKMFSVDENDTDQINNKKRKQNHSRRNTFFQSKEKKSSATNSRSEILLSQSVGQKQ